MNDPTGIKANLARNRLFAEATYSVRVCPACAAQAPEHRGSCLAEEPGLRELHRPMDVVLSSWRGVAKSLLNAERPLSD